MKKLYLSIVCLFLFFGLKAQVLKTIDLTPGNLSNLLTEEEKATITSLTLTGSMNAFDFGTIKRQMPMLIELNMSAVSIDAYKETDPHCRFDVTYPANTLPGVTPYCPDYTLQSLESIILPNSLTAIGNNALSDFGFSTLVIPPLVTTIGDFAFEACKELTNISIPSSVTNIGIGAFSDCSSLTSVELLASIVTINHETFSNCTALNSIDIPSSVTTIGQYAFGECSSLSEISLPPSLTNIGPEAFIGCSALTSIVIPSSVTGIGVSAFANCTSLTTVSIPPFIEEIWPSVFENCTSLSAIYFYRPTPPALGLDNPLQGVDRSTCTLYVPNGSADLYAGAPGWKDFTNIVEMAEFSLSTSAIAFESGPETATVELTADAEWTASSDQPWLTVSPASGSGNASIVLAAEANPSIDKRIARITFTSGNNSPDIIVRQNGMPLTIELTAGNLSSEFPAAELKNVNQLIVTGTMDARDFKFIRDELPLLKELDLTGVTITAYSGPGGTFIQGQQYPDNVIDDNYPANGIPAMAFHEKYPDLYTVRLPESLTSIGTKAFFYCTGLTELDIPSSVTSIGDYAFFLCNSLQNLEIPSDLTVIRPGVFMNCSKLKDLIIPTAVTSIGAYAFSGCEALTSMEIPNTVTSIGKNAFVACTALKTVTLPASLDSIKEETFNTTALTSIRIPASVKYIGSKAFFACYSLNDFYAYPVNPPDLTNETEVFFELNEEKTLHVPFGSKELYQVADQWKDFVNIVEMTEFSLSATSVIMDKSQDSTEVQITSDNAWTASTDQSWLTVNPASGSGNQPLTLHAEANSMETGRTAIVTITGDTFSQAITVFQKGVPKILNLASGTLATALTPDELRETTELILTGEINARDFKTLRDEMPNLALLDMSGATITVYKGNEGTIEDLYTTYPPNKIPPEAFYNKSTDQKSKLTFISLPVATESIGYNAFNSCSFLTGVKIASSLTFIDEGAFKNCSNITYLNLTSVNTIGKDAFNGCQRLTTLKFPFALKSIGEGVFWGCSALNSIYSYVGQAPYLNNLKDVFKGINQKTCTLYVAAGSKEGYEAADQWKDFENIVEMTDPTITPKEITLEPTLGSSATITVSGIGYWTFGWDQPWLDLDKGAGIDDQILTITVDEANTTAKDRICIVTIDPINLDRQIVVVTQKGLATGVPEIVQNKPSFDCYPNPFTQEATIEIHNPQQEKLTVVVYNMNGQKVKNWTINNRAEKISITWNGTNEEGLQVPHGLYLLKVNSQICKLVFGR